MVLAQASGLGNQKIARPRSEPLLDTEEQIN